MHRTKVRVVEYALDANNPIAGANASDFARSGVTVVNLMSAPGAGKTTLLERSLEGLVDEDPPALRKALPARVADEAHAHDRAHADHDHADHERATA